MAVAADLLCLARVVLSADLVFFAVPVEAVSLAIACYWQTCHQQVCLAEDFLPQQVQVAEVTIYLQ